MSSEDQCNKWMNWYRDPDNEARSLEMRLFRERQAVSMQESKIAEMERDLRVDEAQLLSSGIAGRVFGPGGGAAVTALSKLTLETRIGRIKDEVITARNARARMKDQ